MGKKTSTPVVSLLSFLMIAAAIAGCESKKSDKRASDSGTTEPAGETGRASTADLVVTGQLAISTVAPEVLGVDGVSLNQREVEILNASGAVVAKSITGADGFYSAILPGSIAIDTSDGKNVTTLALADAALTLRSVITNTADSSVIGINKPLDLAAAVKTRVLELGATELEKITAIRGKVTIDGARDNTGISVYIPGTSYAARTDAAGNFTMTFIPAGTYNLRLEKDGFEPIDVANVTVADKETVVLPLQILRISGGTGFFSIKQVGTEGLSSTRKVSYLVSPGDADRFKYGLPSDVETGTYGSVPTEFSFTFPGDGEFQLKMVFATADGFESSITKTVVVDTVVPSAAGVNLVDRTSLSPLYSNESQVMAYHPSCEDMDALAILPATATAPISTDFIFSCFSNVTGSENMFQMAGATFSYKIWVRDRVGNISAAPSTGTITVDTVHPEAPAITLRDQTTSFAAAANERTVDVDVATCTGIKNILVSESQLSQPPVSAIVTPCAATVVHTFANNLEGIKTVFVWAIDHAGNVSAISSSDSIDYDYTPPAATTLALADPTPSNSGYSNSLTLNATLGSCAGTPYVHLTETQSSAPAETDAGWQSCTTTGINLVAAGQGLVTGYLWAKDPAGNVSSVSSTGTITVDTTNPSAPVLTVSDNSNSGTTYTNGTTVAVGIATCADADKVYLSQSGTAPAAASVTTACSTSGLTFTLSNATEETKTVYLFVKDLAGNVSGSGSNDTIIMDTTAPSFPGSFAARDTSMLSTTYSNSTSADFVIDACPTGAVLLVRQGQSTAPGENDSGWFSCSTSGTLSSLLTTTEGSAQTVYLWVKDDAGNVSASSMNHSITYDSTPPTAPTFATEDDSGSSSTGYTDGLTSDLTISSCADIAGVYFSESASTPAEGTVATACNTGADFYQYTFSGTEGYKSLYLWVKDAAGNISSQNSSIYYDSSTPVVSNVAVTSMGTDTITLTWTTSEPTRTRVEYGTSTGVYAFNHDLNETPGSASTSHTATVTTNLAAGTTYYFRVAGPDFAEHTGYAAEQNFNTFGLNKIFHTENLAKLGGSVPSVNASSTRRQMVACDVRGDTKDEIVVAAPGSTSNGFAENGNVYVFLGGAISGSIRTVPGTDAVLTINGDSADDRLGTNVICLDFNGDGKKDLLVTEVAGSSGNGYIFYGSTSTTVDTKDTASTYDVKFTMDNFYSSAAGQFDNDALDDVALCTNTECNIFYGRTGSPLTLAAAAYSHRISGSVNIYIGAAFADVDGDSYDDLLMGSFGANGEDTLTPDTGAVYIKRGGNIASGTTTTFSVSSGYDYAIYGYLTGQHLMMPVAGDINNDGFADILMRRYYGASDIHIVFGRDDTAVAGLDWTDDTKIQATTLRFTAVSMEPGWGEYFLIGNYQINDFDGDGFGDVIIGYPMFNSNRGKVCLFRGRSQADWNTLGPDITSAEADVCINAADPTNLLGASVAIGQIDGTGNKELIFGAPGGAGSADAGGANGEVGVMSITIPTITHTLINFDLAPHF